MVGWRELGRLAIEKGFLWGVFGGWVGWLGGGVVR